MYITLSHNKIKIIENQRKSLWKLNYNAMNLYGRISWTICGLVGWFYGLLFIVLFSAEASLFANIYMVISCLDFWDEAWLFLSLRVFGLLTSSLLLFSQRFGRYVLWPSGVCRTREPTRNFELRPLLNQRGSPVLIPLAITGYKC